MTPQLAILLVVFLLILLVLEVESTFKKCFWCKKRFVIDNTKIKREGLWYASIECHRCGWVNRLYRGRF